jgi:hypothetical protein
MTNVLLMLIILELLAIFSRIGEEHKDEQRINHGKTD